MHQYESSLQFPYIHNYICTTRNTWCMIRAWFENLLHWILLRKPDTIKSLFEQVCKTSILVMMRFTKKAIWHLSKLAKLLSFFYCVSFSGERFFWGNERNYFSHIPGQRGFLIGLNDFMRLFWARFMYVLRTFRKGIFQC
jgi:hypothetical protein